MSPATLIGPQALPSVAIAGAANFVPDGLPLFQCLGLPGMIKVRSSSLILTGVWVALRMYSSPTV